MRPVVLDTGVFSFLLKRDTRAARYAPHLVGAQPCLSFQSVAELRLWALARRWGEPRSAALEASLARCLVFPYDDEMSRRWAAISAHRRHIGQPIECGDAWIAASALRHGAPLLTHNRRHYVDIPGLTVISEG
jgi:predicted nucleic acid-binding protein